jgi:hypothetical protein
MLLFTGLGFYTAYYKGYHQWEPALKDTTAFVSNERLNIYLSPQQKNETESLIEYIQTHTKSDEYIFINYYSPMIYFIADRKNPTAYDLIGPNQLPLSDQKSIVRTLVAKDIRFVVMHEFNKNDQSVVSNYVKKNYKINKVISGFLLMHKIN